MRKIISAIIICLLTGPAASTGIAAAERTSGKSSESKISHPGKNQRQIEIPAKFLALKLKERDNSLAVSVESVLQKLKEKQRLILIDVRNEKEFEGIRIPGSLNIPLFAIKTKAFLKAKNLVLFNEGYSYSGLEQECKRLKNSGFTAVSILNGGLTYWKEKGGALEGDLFQQKELNKVPSREFFAERNYKNWTLIDISETRNTEADRLIPQGVHIPYTNNPKEFVAKIKTNMDKHNQDFFLSVLVFNEKGGYQKIEKLLRKAGMGSVFFLKGGLDGYKAFLQEQALIWRSKNDLKKTGKKCKSCP